VSKDTPWRPVASLFRWLNLAITNDCTELGETIFRGHDSPLNAINSNPSAELPLPYVRKAQAFVIICRLGERQIENYQRDANPLRPFRPTLPEGQ